MTDLTKATNKGYVIHTYRVNKDQLEYVNGLTKDLEEGSAGLFKHLLASTLVTRIISDEDTYIPVSYKLMTKEFGKRVSWRILEERGLVEATDYSISRALSREFRVNREIVEKVLDLAIVSINNIGKANYNLITGRKSVVRGSRLYDLNNNQLPEIVREALEEIGVCYIQLERVIDYITHVGKEVAKLKGGLQMGLVSQSHYNKQYYRYMNDKQCLASILARNPQRVGDSGVWSFIPSYEMQMSGRVSLEGGGLQSASRAFKYLAYEGIENLNNYDLVSSQVNGLIQQLQLAGVDASWLENYRDNKESKFNYAAKVGVSVKCWKNMLCALIMGAYLPKKITRSVTDSLENGAGGSAIVDYIINEIDSPEQRVEVLSNFSKCVKPLKDALDRWHTYLVEYALTKSVKVNHKRFLTNAVGAKLNVSDLMRNPEWKVKATLAAFTLQGQEAAYIHTLTSLSPKYGFKVLANEHDGLVTIGEIPVEAMEEAAKLSGLENAKLDIKEFISMEEDALLRAYVEREEEVEEVLEELEAVKQEMRKEVRVRREYQIEWDIINDRYEVVNGKVKSWTELEEEEEDRIIKGFLRWYKQKENTIERQEVRSVLLA
jgi:hypothetical protein